MGFIYLVNNYPPTKKKYKQAPRITAGSYFLFYFIIFFIYLFYFFV